MYRRYAADVYHYALAICRNADDAEDVTQTTFMNAYRAVQAGEDPRVPKNWLIAIAHNVCRQRYRHAARRPAEVELEDGVAAVVPEDDGPGAEDIRRALGELAFNQRAALVMRELEGRSYAEIAEILGSSVSAVETLIFRARRALREQLEGSLTCGEAELALSKQLDGRLSRSDKGALRAHLRSCKECASFARSQRAQRSALRGLAAVPLPSSLASLFGGGGAAVGGALATKAAAVTALGLLITGAGVETARQHPWRAHRAAPSRTAAQAEASAPEPATAAVGASEDGQALVKVRKPHDTKTLPARRKHGAAPTATATPAATHTAHPAHPVHATRPARPVHPAHPGRTQTKKKPKKQHVHASGPPASSGQGNPAGTPQNGTGRPAGSDGQGNGGGPPSKSHAKSARGTTVTLPLLPVELQLPSLP